MCHRPVFSKQPNWTRLPKVLLPKPLASGEEGWKDMKLIGAILEVAETGRKVAIDWRA